MLARVLLTILAFTVYTCGKASNQPSTHDQNAQGAALQKGAFSVIAHRGASGTAPENTLPAIAKAMDSQANMVEVDFNESADGTLLLLHDNSLNRTTDAGQKLGEGENLVYKTPWESIRKLDAGSWFGTEFKHTSVPSLLAAIRFSQNKTILLIERKGGKPEPLVKLIRDLNAIENVIVQSFSWSFIKAVKALEPKIVTVALGRGEITDERLSDVVKIGASAINWAHSFLSAEVVKRVEGVGLQVLAFTVDDVQVAENLKLMGVNGVVTNYPERMGHLR